MKPMRILFFTNTPSNYTQRKGGYNGGGWISSLESELSGREEIELAVSFFLDGQPRRVESRSGVVYYPLPTGQSLPRKLSGLLTPHAQAHERKTWKAIERKLLAVVDDFKPDLIEVFGSERQFGLIASQTQVPVVLHIQGILTPYYNAFLPPFISLHNYLYASRRPVDILRKIQSVRSWRCSVMREQEILRRVNYYIGRTDWDYRITHIYNPRSQYFYGSEILRPVFYEPCKRRIPKRLTIVTTISQPLYKGFDVVLKTAQLLKQTMQINFRWLCFGNIDPRAVERQTGSRHREVDIALMGVATAEQLRDAMLHATVYVHTSYIDNSPNSLCEAQILGLPTISTNVGGVSSLVDDGVTGFLTPANDPYQMAYLISSLHADLERNIAMGKAAAQAARRRHDPTAIVDSLIRTYRHILTPAR